ncbi:MAG: DUF493 domain-containing protein [bacterium]|nr:DUF493 domain-containing protein [bacterium]
MNIQNEKIKFPVKYTLKVIIEVNTGADENIDVLKKILLKLSISHGEITFRVSRNAKYYSYSVEVIVNNQEIFDGLYQALNEIPGMKFAV